LRADTSRRILDEQIEIAYADLYGFDDRIRDLYMAAVSLLKETDGAIYVELLNQTQSNVLDFTDHQGKVDSSDLGNALRKTCADLGRELGASLREILDPFRKEMINLMKASDSQLVGKRFDLSTPKLLFKSCLAKRQELSAKSAKSRISWGPPGCEYELFIPSIWSPNDSLLIPRRGERSAERTNNLSTERVYRPRERVGGDASPTTKANRKHGTR